jgi:FtsP/CotA-like multicopper oxidase with cupredoxin domain
MMKSIILFLLLIRDTLGAIRKFELNINQALLNPDCFNQSYSAVIINNQFPSPALHVLKGDTVQIKVKNDLRNPYDSSIHIHGIRQLGTNEADGVANVTQVAIRPGEEYLQTFHIYNQTGTYYYHAHVGVQDDTIQGPFIVYGNEDSLNAVLTKNKKTIKEGPYTYDGEMIFQWTEWWHQDFFDRQAYYLSSNFPGDTGPQSFLLNGQSIFQNTSCEVNNTALGDNCKGFTYFDVEPNKTYRIRNIAALTFRFLGIAIKDHNMTLIEIDGEYINPVPVDYIEIAPGQRMSVLIQTGNFTDGETFPIVSNFRRRNAGGGYTQNGYGFLRYVCSEEIHEIKMLSTPLVKDLPNVFPAVDPPTWPVLNEVRPLHVPDNLNDLLYKDPTRTIKISMKEAIILNNLTRYTTNEYPYVARPWGNDTISLLDKVLYDEPSIGTLAADGFSVNHQTFPVNYMDVVDLVFQNIYIAANICVPHPWHTHGYSHYLLAEGFGDYRHDIDKDVRSFPVPPYKDVSITYPLLDPTVTYNENCGWTKVRIIAVRNIKVTYIV